MDTELAFGTVGVVAMNGLLAGIMFGVGLGLDLREFRRMLATPIGPAIGLVAQFLLLPALAFGVVRLLDVPTPVALGVLLVCSCPGGTSSNVLTWLARANVSLSIAMTGVSTFLALLMTPLNMAVWGGRLPRSDGLALALDPWVLVLTLVLVLGVPVTAGVLFQRRYPERAARLDPVVRRLAAIGILLLIVGGFGANVTRASGAVQGTLLPIVTVNLLALALGYGLAVLFRRPRDERRAISIEVGVQNAALAVTLAIQFFPTVPEVTVVAALWGLWHLVSGLILARVWAGEPLLARRRSS